MSDINTPDNKDSCGLLTKILSIKVELVAQNHVGLVISGINEYE